MTMTGNPAANGFLKTVKDLTLTKARNPPANGFLVRWPLCQYDYDNPVKNGFPVTTVQVIEGGGTSSSN